MNDVILITGATGSVGRELAGALACDPAVERIYAVSRGIGSTPELPKVAWIRGDVTLPLRLDVAREITVIVHAAADTRFSTSLDAARAVNVGGLEQVLALASRCPRLRRMAHLSTIYVAGRRCGRVLENELDHNAGFVNAYEQSKYESEQLVRTWANKVPIAVYRLSTIIGEEAGGDPGKLGAIHQAMGFMYHSLAPMIPGSPGNLIDLISLNYAVGSIAWLLRHRFEPGSTLHICGADESLTLDELLDLVIDCFHRFRPAWRKRAIAKPAVVPLETFELFVRSVEEIGEATLCRCVNAIKHFAPQMFYSKRFDDSQAQRALADSGIQRPRMRQLCSQVVRRLIETNWTAAGRELVTP
jgi:nucleoside-diphosphate-sugar epimerase